MSKRPLFGEHKRSVPPRSVCHFPFLCGGGSVSMQPVLDRADLICPDGGMYSCDTSPVSFMLIPASLNVSLVEGYFCGFHQSIFHEVAMAFEEDMTVPFLAALTKEELQGDFEQLKPFTSEPTTSI